MPAAFVRLACIVALCLGACSNQDQNESIKAMNLGVEAANAQQYSVAERHLKDAVRVYPENHRAWYNLGQIYAQQKDWEKAAEAFGKAVEHQSEDAMYQYRLGKAELMTAQLPLAETHLQQAVKLNDRLFKAYWYLGQVYDATDRPHEAAAAWTKSATLNPLFGPPFIDLGRLYITWDMLSEAISVLHQGSQNVKDIDRLSDIYYYLGLAYDRQRQWDEAAQAFSKALEAQPDNIEAKLQRGFAYAELGKKDDAEKDLKEFIDRGGGGSAFNLQAANAQLGRLLTH
ncbi:MAG TPA: tetratricopeptide repeat protein [Kofleriaceae bacterium]|nr:tetratricopeptide repeat protein [Kofleriaceae bacterium]